MKTAKDYLNNTQKDSVLKKVFLESTDIDTFCDNANQHGYQFTKKELEEACLNLVSGGFLDKKSQEVCYTPNVNGDYNVVLSFGDISNSDGTSNNKKVDPMEVLSLFFGK